jgi:hypothetical protein
MSPVTNREGSLGDPRLALSTAGWMETRDRADGQLDKREAR